MSLAGPGALCLAVDRPAAASQSSTRILEQPHGTDFSIRSAGDPNFCVTEVETTGQPSSAQMSECATQDAQHWTFVQDADGSVVVVGGSDGLATSLRENAQLRLAFGAATWPHQLVRIMLLEQLYRAVTILSGHPYHRA